LVKLKKRHGLQPSRVQGTDYNRAEYKAPITNRRQQLRARRSQIGASNCELGEAKSAPATASSAKPNPRQQIFIGDPLCLSAFVANSKIVFIKKCIDEL